MSDNVTCQDCVHNRAGWFTRKFSSSVWWECDLKFYPGEVNIVDGKHKKGRYISCSGARNTESVCGEEGKNWIPRSKKNLFILLKRT